MIYIGIDLHTHNMTLAAINDNDEELALEKIKCNKRELESFFSKIDQPVQDVVECTGNWYWLDDWCGETGIPLMLAHAKMLKAISYSKVKTDPVDARMLARLLRVKMIPEAWKTERHRRDLRELTRSRLKWIEKRTKLQNQLSCMVGRYNLQIRSSDWRNIAELKSFLHKQLCSEVYLEARLLIDHVVQTQHSIQQLETAIDAQIWYHEDLKRLMEIPGIGRVSAWTILAEIGDIKRFPTDKQFVSYCRLVPGSNDSAGKHRHKSGSKDGNRYLKLAFTQAALGAYTHYKPVKKFYQKLQSRRSAFIARNVVAKQLARTVWHVLAKNQPYKGFKGQMTIKTKTSYWPCPVSPATPLGVS